MINEEALPHGWQLEKLGDIVEIHDTKRIPLNSKQRSNMKGNYPYCGANGIIDNLNDYIFDGNYLLIAEDGGFWEKYENTSYLMDGKFWPNNHVHVVNALRNRHLMSFYSTFFTMKILKNTLLELQGKN